ncbi:MAG: aspartate kinase [Candidatus Caenarcaniphilales bacterium]|nr:aspartate kinase [Candidatus Caenarcaniphilales bacterium]
MLKEKTTVLKFGGTSVADAECIKRVCSIAIREAESANLIMVVSAMGKTTDGLVKLAKDFNSLPEGRELDMLLSTGEQVTASLVAMCLHEMGYAASSLLAWQSGFITEREHNQARIAKIKTERINEHLAKGEIIVLAGFQGITECGEVTTLGRGGTDTSAVAVAAALGAQKCDIYTDVDGVFTTDPRIIPEAKKLDLISYEEMLELASLGAKVLHPRSVELAKKYNIDLSVRSSFKPEDKGTRVIKLSEVQDMELTQAVTGVALDKKQAKLGFMGVPDTPGIASKIFKTLAENNVSVDVILQSVPREGIIDIAFTVNQDYLQKAIKISKELALEVKAAEVVHDDDIAKISIVGAGMLNKPGIASEMFTALYDADINIQMITTSEIKISCIIDLAQAEAAVKVIHEKFNLAQPVQEIIV